MSSLKHARHAIQAELDYAKQGLSYYQSRVAMLETVLQQLDSTATPKVASKRKRVPANTPSAVRIKPSDAMPQTGSEFWLKFVTDKPQSAVNIANAAAKRLKLDPLADKPLFLKLKSRVSPMLELLVKSEKVTSTGAGRDRRFFRTPE